LKTPEEIYLKASEALTAEIEKRVAEASVRQPHKCLYNHGHTLDTRHLLEGEANPDRNRIVRSDGSPVDQTLGLCLYGAEDPTLWPGNICEDDIDALSCPYFTPHESVETVQKQIFLDFSNPDWVRENVPDVGALMWVLELCDVKPVSWWQKVLHVVTRRSKPVDSGVLRYFPERLKLLGP
jgi:hypothetical protein